MDKMRRSTGIILWVLIFSFGILWMLQDTQVFSALGAGPRALGSVNGESISYQAFNNRVNMYSTRFSKQTGKSMTPEMRAYYEDQVWNELVTGIIIEQRMDELGITVTDQEVVNMIRGENPDPLIQRQFANEDGTFNRVALNRAIKSEQNTQAWVAIEQRLRQKRRQQKMSNYVQSAMQVSDYAVKQQYARNHSTANISYLRFPYATISQEQIEVTEAELKEYYKAHKDQFEQNESYSFKYVSFSTAPTAKDTARTIQELKDLRTDFSNAQNDSLFIARYLSTTSYNPQFVAREDVRELFSPVINLEKGEVTKVLQDNGTLYLLKKLDEQDGQVKFVTLSVAIQADPIATIDKRSGEAEDFRFFAQQEGFESEAERRGLEIQEGSATKGNDFIAGLGQSRQVMDVLEESDEGTISEQIELPGQFVVLKVTGVTPKGPRPFDEVKEQIKTIVFNQKRQNKLASNIAGKLKANKGLEALAKATSQEIATVNTLTESTETIPGAGREPEVIGTIFSLEPGAVSAPIKGISAVYVVRVDSLSKADIDKMGEGEAQKIRAQMQTQKGKAFTQVWLDQLKKEAEIEDYRLQVLSR